jgi:histidinol phosphatase-like PHP family hydrolase
MSAHTNLTDGGASLEEMVRQAEPRGYAYYTVTDHAPNLIMQRMTDEKTLAQRAQLAALASSMVLLHGTALNIAPDGSVDWDEDFLSGFDMCVASVQTENPIPKHGFLELVHPESSRRTGRLADSAGGRAVSPRRPSWPMR